MTGAARPDDAHADLIARILAVSEETRHVEFKRAGDNEKKLKTIVAFANTAGVGSRPRNRLLVDHLREFSDPPNLDAGEGVPMMIAAMRHERLYAPAYRTPPDWPREAVVCVCLNEAQPSTLTQVERYLEQNGSVTNAEIRRLLGDADTLKASRLLRSWVALGLLVLDNPAAAKQHRRHRRAGAAEAQMLLSLLLGKQPGRSP